METSRPNPHRAHDTIQELGLTTESPLDALAGALAAADSGGQLSLAGDVGGVRALALSLLRFPWFAPTQGLDDEAADAWLQWRTSLAAHRSLWEQEEQPEPGHHDAWVQVLDSLLGVLCSPPMDRALKALLVGAGALEALDGETGPATPSSAAPPTAATPTAPTGEPSVIGSSVSVASEALRGARADFITDVLLQPAYELADQVPGRFLVEAAHLQAVRALCELNERQEDCQRLLRRVLRSAGMLWLEVERPDRAAALLQELMELEPSPIIRHYQVRAELLKTMAALTRGTSAFQVAPVVSTLEELADQHPHQWEVRTQLADLYLVQARRCIEERRATDAAETLVKAIAADVAWTPCAALAGDIEGSMHESRLVGKLNQDALRDAAISEQLKTTIRAGFSRGEMWLSRARSWRLFQAWAQAEAARLWAELGLPLGEGTFPDGCLALVEAVAGAPPLESGDDNPWSDDLREAVAGCAPELGAEHIDGPVAAWVSWARRLIRDLAAPVGARDLLFLHRLRDRSMPAAPLGPGPWYRPVLGFGLRETSEGLVVEGVRAGSPAGDSGLQEGDLLLRAQGYSCPSTARILLALLGWQPGQPLALQVQRQGKLHELTMMPTEQREVDKLPVAELRRRVEKLLKLRYDDDLLVLGAPRVGLLCQLREGDRILRLEGVPLDNAAALEQALRSVDMGQFLIFTVQRGDETRLAKVITLSFKE